MTHRLTRDGAALPATASDGGSDSLRQVPPQPPKCAQRQGTDPHMKGDGEFNSNAGMLAQMNKVLTQRGWDVAPDRLLDIQSLKTRVAGLPLHHHAFRHVRADRQEQFAFMLDTQSPVQRSDAPGDLDDGRLIYHRDRTAWQRPLRPEPRYAATVKFVDAYLTWHRAPW